MTSKSKLLTMFSRHSLLVMLNVFRFLKTEITSLTNMISCSLFCWIDSFEVLTTSSTIDTVMERDAWSDIRCQSRWMECWLMLIDPYWRNIRLMVEFDSSAMSEYLVGQELVGDERAKLKKSAIIKRLLLIDEWWEKEESYRLFLMLKSPVMTKTLSVLTSVSLRYFKAKWDKSK